MVHPSRRNCFAATDADRKILETITKYGWTIMYVHGNAPHPDFAFSIGVSERFGHPEFVVAGLDRAPSAWVLNRLGEHVRDGRVFDPSHEGSGLLSGILLNDARIAFRTIERVRYRQLFGTAMWYYGGDEFPMLQVFIPDPQGHFPWDPVFSENRAAQVLEGTSPPFAS